MLIDLPHVKAMFAQRGICATAIMDDAHALQLCRNPEKLADGATRISEKFFGRIAREFQSLGWFVDQSVQLFQRTMNELDALATTGTNGPTMTIPPEWFGARDCYNVER